MRKALLALVSGLVFAPAAYAITICTTPDGKKYAGDNPPAGCVTKDGRSPMEIAPSESPPRAPNGSVSGGSTAHDEAMADVKTNCEAEWGDNFQMQEHCIDTHVKAVRGLKRLNEQNQGSETYDKIFGRCVAEWPGKVAGYNWQMIEHCVKTQVQAYNRLQGR